MNFLNYGYYALNPIKARRSILINVLKKHRDLTVFKALKTKFFNVKYLKHLTSAQRNKLKKAYYNDSVWLYKRSRSLRLNKRIPPHIKMI